MTRPTRPGYGQSVLHRRRSHATHVSGPPAAPYLLGRCGPHSQKKDVEKVPYHGAAVSSLLNLTGWNVAENTLDADSRARIDRCLDELKSAMCELGPDWDVNAFGSTVNGFATSSSDLDVTCFHKRAITETLNHDLMLSALVDDVLPVIKRKSAFRLVEEVLMAKVPIAKLVFEEKLEVDLSCHNLRPILNTRLLKAYSSINDMIRQLGVAVKVWAKAVNVCGASHAHLSSYSFLLLVIYFLQAHNQLRLPTLPAAAFAATNSDNVEGVASVSWICNFSLQELLMMFFRFYFTEFNWGREVVSIRCGARLTADDHTFLKLRSRWTQRLHIEDPYLVDRNLNGTLGWVQEMQLRHAFGSAFFVMQAACAPPVRSAALCLGTAPKDPVGTVRRDGRGRAYDKSLLSMDLRHETEKLGEPSCVLATAQHTRVENTGLLDSARGCKTRDAMGTPFNAAPCADSAGQHIFGSRTVCRSTAKIASRVAKKCVETRTPLEWLGGFETRTPLEWLGG